MKYLFFSGILLFSFLGNGQTLREKTVAAMRASAGQFNHDAYYSVVQESNSLSDEARELLIDILQHKRASIFWFEDGNIGAVSNVKNIYQRMVVLHFLSLYDKAGLTRNFAGENRSWPTFYMTVVVPWIYEDVTNRYQVILIRSLFKEFPSNDRLSRIRSYNQVRSFVRLVPLEKITSSFRLDFIVELIASRSQINSVSLGKKENHFQYFMERIEEINSREDLKRFRSALKHLKVGGRDFKGLLPKKPESSRAIKCSAAMLSS